MAVWEHDDHYYFFDPHGCDENGKYGTIIFGNVSNEKFQDRGKGYPLLTGIDKHRREMSSFSNLCIYHYLSRH